MAIVKDITLDKDSLDLVITDGDFLVLECNQQSSNLIIQLFQGNLFEFPLCGVGILNYLAGSQSAMVIKSKVKQQLETDGFIIQKIDINGSGLNNVKINVEATR